MSALKDLLGASTRRMLEYLAAASRTHPHAIRADYDERLALGDSEADALQWCVEKYQARADHLRRVGAKK